MHRKIAAISAIILILSIVSAFTGSIAYAITGNSQPNTQYTNVGLVVFYTLDSNGDKVPVEVCSGVLISSRLMLTAAHACQHVQTAIVIFDSGPVTWQMVDGHLEVQGVTASFEGVAIPNPNFSMLSEGNGASFISHDIAIIVLDEAVPSDIVSEYGVLPEGGTVDTLPVITSVELVGYGMQQHLSPRNGGVKETWTGLLMRSSAQAQLLSGNFAWSDQFIRCSANPGNSRGGIAYGDSGGPVFQQQTNTVLALHSYVNNPNCVGVTYHNRIDTVDILSWISEEVELYE